jgi:hypothetical protein
MKKSYLIITLAAVAIVFLSIFIIKKPSTSSELPSPTQKPATMYEYYWGQGCPHCENVDTFMESWDGADKIEINKMEVYNYPENAKQMVRRVADCTNIPPSDRGGVPLLITPDGQCLQGDTPIIDYFKGLEL